jgi:hypothetical protein
LDEDKETVPFNEMKITLFSAAKKTITDVSTKTIERVEAFLMIMK